MDIGTTNIKAGAFELNGTEIQIVSLPTPEHRLGEGKAVYSPEKTIQIVISLLQSLKKTLAGSYRIEGIGIAGMGESGLLIDEAGEALCPLIAWFDRREIPAFEWWKKTFDRDRIIEITGVCPQYFLSANKLVWLKTDMPDVFSKAYKWLCIEGYICYKLTGKMAMSESIGCKTMLMDIRSHKWSDELLAHAGIPGSLMPPLVKAGSFIGKITGTIASVTGIPEGTPVYAGGHDHLCGALASGVIREGQVLDSSGTSEVIFMPQDRLENIIEKAKEGFNTSLHVVSGKYCTHGGMTASGVAMDWFNMISSITRQEHEQKIPGAHGLYFLPHLRGGSSPERNPHSRGCFLGLNENHTLYDFSQAVCEGLCYELKDMFEKLAEGNRPEYITAIGGGTNNRYWMQTKANILGIPIEICQVNEAVSLGAAVLAGIGAKIYHNEEEAVSRIRKQGILIEPDKAWEVFYSERFMAFQEMYQCLLPLNEKIGRLTVLRKQS